MKQKFTQLKWETWKKVKGARQLSRYLRQRRALTGRGYLTVLHYDIPNWGDAINKALVTHLSGKPVLSLDIDARTMVPPPRNAEADTVYLVVGSVLAHADCQTVVWGAGLQSHDLAPRQLPKQICAVRGPLTAAALREKHIACPSVFGDPALLLPRFLKPAVDKRYRLGLIAHRKDHEDPNVQRFAHRDDVCIINMRDVSNAVIERLLACECIVSTSLHGLIAADAYGVPSGWLRVSNKIPGGFFKYRDYYASIGDAQTEPDVYLTRDTTVDALCRATRAREVRLDLDELLRACPFARELERGAADGVERPAAAEPGALTA